MKGLSALRRPGLTLEAGSQQEPDEEGRYDDSYLYEDIDYWDEYDSDWE